jgi:hypothetical protein
LAAGAQSAAEPPGDPAASLADRWEIDDDAITWLVEDDHTDHIEFSGLRVAAIVRYGADEDGELVRERKVVWPMLRTIPNDTHASLIRDFGKAANPVLTVDGRTLTSEKLRRVTWDGTLTLESDAGAGLTITRRLYPSTSSPVICEAFTVTNGSGRTIALEITSPDVHIETDATRGLDGSYALEARTSTEGTFALAPGAAHSFALTFSGRRASEPASAVEVDAAQELERRRAFVRELESNLVLDTPDPVLNHMFAFAKLRAAESIFATKGGLMHGPGGGRYYAAIWANDQAEYVNPFFPYLGNNNANESARNSFRLFATYMNADFDPIPSSIIAEGQDFWNGAGDRGDQAMIAYGAARFALGMGEREVGQELWPLITWCLEYLERQRTDAGVIASDSDELEGRFPAGDANLNTSVLTYGALKDAARLGRELGHGELAAGYDRRAIALRDSIERFFGATVQGFDTYRYFEGNTKLRAWICVPLAFGIFERKAGTLAALLSPKLWNENGVYSEAGNATFWDRATLYAFRGILAAGETDTALRYAQYYSRKRLLGEHVPYAVEAWPEGDQRHLSAESGLYCRVFTEGLFGLEPTGFGTIVLAPRLPTGWDHMALDHVRLFGLDFDIEVERTETGTRVRVRQGSATPLDVIWDGSAPLEVTLH